MIQDFMTEPDEIFISRGIFVNAFIEDYRIL